MLDRNLGIAKMVTQVCVQYTAKIVCNARGLIDLFSGTAESRDTQLSGPYLLCRGLNSINPNTYKLL
jgi:hypothetical protein